MFYLTTHSTHFIYGYMASNIWLRTILIVRKETRCRHIGYSFRLPARVILYAPSHRQDCTYHTAFVTPVVEHRLEREIAQWVHPMKDRSDDPPHHERTLLPRSYISLLFFKPTPRKCYYSVCVSLTKTFLSFVCLQCKKAVAGVTHLLHICPMVLCTVPPPCDVPLETHHMRFGDLTCPTCQLCPTGHETGPAPGTVRTRHSSEYIWFFLFCFLIFVLRFITIYYPQIKLTVSRLEFLTLVIRSEDRRKGGHFFLI